MLALMLATACAGVFFGAAIYVNLVEHPARVWMQGGLAVPGLVAGLWSAWVLRDVQVAAPTVLMGLVVPLTLLVIFPTNKQLLDPGLDPRSGQAAALLTRWNRLHAIRSAFSDLAFALFLMRIAARGR